MTADARKTAFVTGATGFLGFELVKALLRRGHEVLGLAHSIEGAERLRRAGAVAVIGSLFEPGQWQDEAAADWVFHLEPYGERRPRLTLKAGECFARISSDANLLDTLATGRTRRIVYVADASYYGATGVRPITEEQTPQPFTRSRCLTPALNRLDGYIVTGLPIVTALPGVVYGDGSWFRERVADPLMTGQRLLPLGNSGNWISPIHVHDCARALVHLATRGETGSRYFVVNTEAARMRDFAAAFARLANRPLRLWRLPAPVARLLAGSALAPYLRNDALFSNIRLRATGFRFAYPTLDDGLEQVLRAIQV